MDVQSLLNASSTTSYEVGEAGGTLGKDEFMTMLITQMQNQDPMEPVDNAEMTAQLAQLSSLEQMKNLNNQFEGFQQSTAAAISLMNTGKAVTLEMTSGASVEGTLEKVQWVDGDTQFVVDGEAYSVGDVESLRAAETLTEEESA